MIIIDVKDGETIDRALKRYKRKHRNIGLVRELRRRKQFTKPSILRRNELLKAKYKQELLEKESEAF
ncbi:MAG: 30S ribosomal protein S21 [Phaeodactylibacter sp.]|nr:30S ribosomal protein S21 [Phaeodactylibacter sp.]MCB9301839.1 30S ribosomal protein S21 [Lewinellaceae bacterium]HQU60723.1 30S ribosomal protein S21 [Saprospiraceae bacterium]